MAGEQIPLSSMIWSETPLQNMKKYFNASLGKFKHILKIKLTVKKALIKQIVSNYVEEK